MLQVGGVVGTFALGSVIDRFSFRALALVYFIAVFAVGAIGQLGHSVVFVTMAIFAAGFCVIGGQIAANALAAAFYPTSVRATGVGWALGIGRVGSIVGPLVGGMLLTMNGARHRSLWRPRPQLLRGAGGVLAQPARGHGRERQGAPQPSPHMKLPCVRRRRRDVEAKAESVNGQGDLRDVEGRR